jgi:hypothetical protein
MFDYKVIPAPARAEKRKGVKDPATKFALTLETVLGAQAAQGWEYLRAETLPCEERKGLTGTVQVFHSVLVFRRPVTVDGPVATPAQPEPEPRGGSLAPEAQGGGAPVETPATA